MKCILRYGIGVVWLGAVAAMAAPAPLTVAAGTKVKMVVTRPVWAATAKAGDPVYLQVTTPVLDGITVAIPEGSYVLAQIQKITKPTRKLNQAVLLMDMQQIILANGYTVTLPNPGKENVSVVTLQASPTNDLLLDNGTALELAVGPALRLRRSQVTKSVAMAKTVNLLAMASATRCVPTPGTDGTPGTSDTVIPGSPGTPPVTITDADGNSITVSPGTPATPDTVIPGMMATPGTAPTYCPAPPVMTSSVLVTLSDTTSSPATGSKQ